MGDEDRWAKLEQIMRKVVGEELEARGFKSKTKIGFLNGQWTGLTAEQLSAWGVAYGSVDIQSELKKAAAWIVSNPHLAPRSNFARFMNTWLAKQQNVSAIRSIPTRSEQKERLCAYCGVPAAANANGYWHCREHTEAAMEGRRPMQAVK